MSAVKGKTRRGSKTGASIAVLAVLLAGIALILFLRLRSAAPNDAAPQEASPSPASAAADKAAAETADPLSDPVGRWHSEDGVAELVIWSETDGTVRFSLFSPGHDSINNVETKLNDSDGFVYSDPYHKGNCAVGSLGIGEGKLILSVRDSNMDLPQGGSLVFSEKTEGPSYQDLYAPVLDAYRDYERRGGGLENWYGEEEDNYVHAGLSGVTRVGTMLWDLDGNGVPELILAPYYTQEDFAASEWLKPGDYTANIIMDLYTLRDGVPVHVLLSGDRYRNSLTTDGQIYYSGSSGAAYTTAYLCSLEDGNLRFVEGVCIDGSEERTFQLNAIDNGDRENDTAISYEEYQYRMEQLFHYTRDLLAPLQLEPLTPAE